MPETSEVLTEPCAPEVWELPSDEIPRTCRRGREYTARFSALRGFGGRPKLDFKLKPPDIYPSSPTEAWTCHPSLYLDGSRYNQGCFFSWRGRGVVCVCVCVTWKCVCVCDQFTVCVAKISCIDEKANEMMN